MQTPTNPVTSGSKLLSFARPAVPFPPGQMPAATASRPKLVLSSPPSLPVLPAAAALAHDARNALTSLELLSGFLGTPGMLPNEHAHIPADLHTIARTLDGLIRDFEALGVGRNFAPVARLNSQPQALRAISAGDALEDCASLLRTVAGPKVSLNISSEKRLPPLRISEDAFHRVLTNLVRNASEAMPNGGIVRITARRALSLTAPAVLVHVSDNGPGIPAYALGQIFDPGFSSKRNASEACGLGLAIVRELVEASGGKIRVASTRGRGTSFELRLQCAAKVRS